MVIRSERTGDIDAIGHLHRRAFPSDLESRLVDALRQAGNAAISLVAEDDDGAVVGHVLFSPVQTEHGSARGLGLAPVAVVPERQRAGIGSALIREGIRRAREARFELLVVLGDPEYYGRFGFTRASAAGLSNEYGVDEPFMVLELSAEALSHVSGLVQYSPEFNTSTSPEPE
ncbi:MAG: GNAT family N-acetyltransferase [Luteitalea sp.]|nr:GNAT family N-acetyltransferase [Luteitalea sp.]